MKKIIIIVFLLPFLLFTNSFAQNKDDRELDWSDFSKSIQKTIIAEPAQTGKFTVFSIKNINKFLYKVEIKGSSFELSTPIPTELETLFRLKPTELAKTENNKKAEDGTKEIEKAVEPMKKAKLDINTASFATKKPDPIKKSALESAIDEVIENCKEYYEIAKKVSQDIFLLKKRRNELIVIAQTDVGSDEIALLVNALGSFSESTILENYTKFKEKYQDLEELYDAASAKASDDDALKEKLNEIEKALKSLEKGTKLIDEESLLGILAEVNYFSTELKNPKNFIIVAPPVQVDGDFVNYDVKITPSVTKTLGPNRNPINFNFDVPAKGGWKVDFSVGPVFSFGKNAKDEKYYIEDVPLKTDTVVFKKRENNNAINPGMFAMMHVYKRSGKPFSWGGVFGVGAGFQSISDANLSFLVGASGVIGKRQKIMISTGISYNRVERLKEKEFIINTEYPSSKIELSNLTEKVFKPSFFLSVSYNITNKIEVK